MHQLDLILPHNLGTPLPANAYNQINAWALAYGGKQVRVRVGPPERSSLASKYYWAGVNRPVVEALHAAGYTNISAAMFHEHCKHKYLSPVHQDTPIGQILVYTTKTLDSAQFTHFIAQIITDEITLRLGVRIETPTEYQDRTQQRFKSWGIE